MRLKIFKYIIQLVFTIFIFQACNDSGEDVDPDKNAPTISVNGIIASIIGQSNGMIIVSATGGLSPYTFSIDGTSFQNSGTFSNLGPNDYTVMVKDKNNLTDTKLITIREVQVIFYANQIRPIIDGNCQISGCHGSNSSIPSWATYNDVKAKADRVKVRTGDKSMPRGGSITDEEIALIADWVDQGAPEN